jgi:RNase P/RNase MRP subunit p29
MKKSVMLVAVALVGFSASASAAPKTYQVTGPVLEMTANAIVVQKGSEKWEIARGDAAVPETVKVGSKVTIEYTMTAKNVTAKDAKPAAATPPKM